eukprot:828835-Rhodomonas_salina.6
MARVFKTGQSRRYSRYLVEPPSSFCGDENKQSQSSEVLTWRVLRRGETACWGEEYPVVCWCAVRVAPSSNVSELACASFVDAFAAAKLCSKLACTVPCWYRPSDPAPVWAASMMRDGVSGPGAEQVMYTCDMDSVGPFRVKKCEFHLPPFTFAHQCRGERLGGLASGRGRLKRARAHRQRWSRCSPASSHLLTSVFLVPLLPPFSSQDLVAGLSGVQADHLLANLFVVGQLMEDGVVCAPNSMAVTS